MRRTASLTRGIALLSGLLVTLQARASFGSHDVGLPVAGAPAAAPTIAIPIEQQIPPERAVLAAELNDARRRLKMAASDAQDDLKQEVELLQQVDLLYGQELATIKAGAEVATEQQQIASEHRSSSAPDIGEPPPYSFMTLDRALDALDAATDRAQTATANVAAAEAAVEQARSLMEGRERARRQARERVETTRDAAMLPAAERSLRLRQLESRLATEDARLRQLELLNATRQHDLQNARQSALTQRAELIAKDTRFLQAELDAQLGRIEGEEAELRRGLTSAMLEQDAAERRAMMAQQRYEQATEPSRVLAAEVAARRLAQQGLQQEVAGVAQRLQQLAQVKQLWTRRFEAANGTAARAELTVWERETEQALEQLAREERVARRRLTELRDQAQSVSQELLANATESPDVAHWLLEQEQRLHEQSTLFENRLADFEGIRRLNERLLRDVVARSRSLTLRERLGVARDAVYRAWSYELTSVDDRPITSGKIVLALLLLTSGFWVARVLSRVLGRRLLPRLGLDAGASAAVQSLTFYVLLVLLTLSALHAVNVPLTIFTLVGGALAIGFGFGSQNIVNNFISGLILLAERPINVGDLVEFDGTHGTVMRIGPRSTLVRAHDHTEIIVPNSHFLEKSVVNWTLSDDTVLTHVAVGVMYGAPTQEVSRLLRDTIRDHEKIFKDPEPFVLLADFGDNALVFEVYFYLRVRDHMDRQVVESDVRHRLNTALQAAGISIAFPQRDLHLDSAKPIEVRVLTGSAAPVGHRNGLSPAAAGD